ITGWPGGKPDADDTYRPERAKPFPKRCLVLSPEPQDAVVGMGGTLDRLTEQGHDVVLAALTSGSLRVPDSEADKFASTLAELGGLSSNTEDWKEQTDYAREMLRILEEKGEFGEDPPVLRQLKGLVLRGEFRDAAHALRLTSEKVRFLDLPFYERGRYRRFHAAEEDIAAVVDLLNKVRPHQIYCTGDAADPSSVAGISYGILLAALKQCSAEDWASTCSLWSYRGREKALEAHEIDMAVPMSPQQLETKARALTRFGSLSSLEQHAPERNRAHAAEYDALGLAEYEAIEAFQRLSRR
ncbi:MAG: PIG-L family deacetylase, partial [Verrucomicrobiales bacterium]|nr:PIG-L family deacetylase [Verrucomicrobiales bacterium]